MPDLLHRQWHPGSHRPRPTPHDLIKEILENWGINATMAKIERMEAGTYYATLVLEQDNRTLLLDTRPSDSIATAIRFGAPIYINEDMLKEHGREIC
ncbi:MAG: bifunctional nuclease family protein [Candidatus Aminicenantales bacterium]